jgi:hypothetical protein
MQAHQKVASAWYTPPLKRLQLHQLYHYVRRGMGYEEEVLKLKLHWRNISANSTVPLCTLNPSFSDLINKPAQKMRRGEDKLLIKSHLRSFVIQSPHFVMAT